MVRAANAADGCGQDEAETMKWREDQDPDADGNDLDPVDAVLESFTEEVLASLGLHDPPEDPAREEGKQHRCRTAPV